MPRHIASVRQQDATFAFPLSVDRQKPIGAQMAAAMLALHRVFGSCEERDLLAVGFTADDLQIHRHVARLMAYQAAPHLSANDVRPHLSDEDIAAGLTKSTLPPEFPGGCRYRERVA
ncbi:hypothetical protein ACFPL7_22090 [Dongia soli]|uniref:Uncharacterized protein n=1 Tax=Dongia soli TaxID=600628 RepID=A0ABU5E7X1_9PROT|nr:hypothetical protein [Dongia soli]MDY0882281.1 hypothetical protein [Dongia soli]